MGKMVKRSNEGEESIESILNDILSDSYRIFDFAIGTHSINDRSTKLEL